MRSLCGVNRATCCLYDGGGSSKYEACFNRNVCPRLRLCYIWHLANNSRWICCSCNFSSITTKDAMRFIFWIVRMNIYSMWLSGSGSEQLLQLNSSHPSIFHIRSSLSGLWGDGADPAWLWARGGVHRGQDARQTTIHTFTPTGKLDNQFNQEPNQTPSLYTFAAPTHPDLALLWNSQ